jgi:hypothetical protein
VPKSVRHKSQDTSTRANYSFTNGSTALAAWQPRSAQVPTDPSIYCYHVACTHSERLCSLQKTYRAFVCTDPVRQTLRTAVHASPRHVPFHRQHRTEPHAQRPLHVARGIPTQRTGAGRLSRHIMRGGAALHIGHARDGVRTVHSSHSQFIRRGRRAASLHAHMERRACLSTTQSLVVLCAYDLNWRQRPYKRSTVYSSAQFPSVEDDCV